MLEIAWEYSRMARMYKYYKYLDSKFRDFPDGLPSKVDIQIGIYADGLKNSL
jgi:hypothetical protein